MTSPRSAHLISFDASESVPTTTLSSPLLCPSRTLRSSAVEATRGRLPTSMPIGAKRLRNVSTCCRANTVVGTTIATCFPARTVAAARSKYQPERSEDREGTRRRVSIAVTAPAVGPGAECSRETG